MDIIDNLIYNRNSIKTIDKKISEITQEDYKNFVHQHLYIIKRLSISFIENLFLLDMKNYYLNDNTSTTFPFNEGDRIIQWNDLFLHIPQKRHSEFHQIITHASQFFNSQPIENKSYMTLIIQLSQEENNYKSGISIEYMPFILDKNGNTWIALCKQFLLPKLSENQSIFIHSKQDNTLYKCLNGNWQKLDLGIKQQEIEILKLLSFGLQIKEISLKLNKSESTIKHKISEILNKTNCKTSVETIAYLHSLHLI